MKLEKLNASNDKILLELRALSESITKLYKKGDEILEKSYIHVDSIKEEFANLSAKALANLDKK